MALLKSAWEIALEKTESITADPEKNRIDTLRTEGRKLAGAYLTSDDPEDTTFDKTYRASKEDDRIHLRQGIASTILMNIALPQSEEYASRFEKILHMATVIDGKESSSLHLLEQINQFFSQYLTTKDKLVERVKQQFQQVFDQKQEMLTQKYGKGVEMAMERDPEFIQLLQKHYSQLTNQYQSVLDQARDQLRSEWGIE
ncbi:MAG: DUF6657 family protein [Sphaerochaetaceae bacterium]|jgi:hypothetical protein|nr:hypothetical protein [Sphaerochaetaceae bacterium]NLO61112.1 hypothetical protein [Spirochaetales bacterium]MDD4259553.1 hypothetical protein [Sphaerochaetaceae bacterium]MDD4763642.1 hypothetical protein [Sphaerochaetaceae bacterium]MDD4841428.1 hypothetical protein [Sphaerochaetaceae bacterium]